MRIFCRCESSSNFFTTLFAVCCCCCAMVEKIGNIVLNFVTHPPTHIFCILLSAALIHSIHRLFVNQIPNNQTFQSEIKSSICSSCMCNTFEFFTQKLCYNSTEIRWVKFKLFPSPSSKCSSTERKSCFPLSFTLSDQRRRERN